jgi:succinoglycan biosynthesis transport protein ExoP
MQTTVTNMPDNHLMKAPPSPAEQRSGQYLPVPADVYRAPNYVEMETGQTGTPFSHYLWILRRQWWKILTFVTIAALATLVVSKRLTPVYESTSIVDVDRQMPSGIIGQEANRAAGNDADQFLATQVKLIQSDSVLRPVADKFNLRTVETQDAGGSAFASAAAQDAPVLLKQLKVTRPPNTYLLLISYRSTNPRLAAEVANGVTNSYLDHTYKIRFQSSAKLASFMEQQIDELKAKMERSGAAVAQFEKELNVINPEEKTSILSSRLLQLNTEYTNAQTDRVRKETAFKSVNSGTMEAAQVSSQGEALKPLSLRLDEAQQKLADVKIHFGVNHPEYKKADTQVAEIERQLERGKQNIGQRVAVEYQDSVHREAMLQKAVAETKTEFDHVNARSYEYQVVKREADADKKLYEELVTKIKEAGINSGFQNSAIRIADLARAAVVPIFPNIPVNLTLAILFSTILAIGAAVLADLLNTAVRDPDQVTRLMNTAVVGVLPRTKELRAFQATANGNNPGSALMLPDSSSQERMTGYNEAIRTLRNSIFLTDFDRRVRSLMVTSPSPSEGKSTISAHLAMANAQQGRKTLLIDADMRRPSVHRQFSMPNTHGLSNILNHEVEWQSVVVSSVETPNLDIITAGPSSRRAADLVGGELSTLLEAVSAKYDLVILDTPPLLGFSEPLQMATAVDGVLLVALASQTNRKALRTAVNMLTRLRANLLGVVLNGVTASTSDGYYYHSYNSKYYQRYQPSGAAKG